MSLLEEMAEAYGNAYQSEFRKLLENLSPHASRFLEWGSGVTTGILCEVAKARDNPFVLSIDHNTAYQKRVAAELPKYPFLHLRPQDLQGRSYSQADMGPSYSSYPLYIRASFDVIFIDGRRRMECALTATQCLNEGGFVILHDWRRDRYQAIRALFDVVSEEGEFLILRHKPSVGQYKPHREHDDRVAVVVPVRGHRAERELSITRPFFEAYATAIGADFRTVGRESTLPPHRLKAAALEVADEYDRIIVADCDMLIRPHTPSLFSIVPHTDMGVFFEGQFFPRTQACSELKTIYAMEEELPSDAYFNSGIMVLSRPHYALLHSLKDAELFGHPQYEQGFLNVARTALAIPTYPLSADLNYIPDAEFLSTDWRFGFIVHFAGSGKDHYNFQNIWQAVGEDGRTFTLRKGGSADIRDTLLRLAAREMAGELVYMTDPTDFIYESKHAFFYGSPQGQVLGRVRAIKAPEPTLAVYGAKRGLARGSYEARFIALEEQILIVPEAKFDVMLNGERVIADGFWPTDGVIRFELGEDTPYVEVRLYCASSDYEFVRLEITPGIA